MFPPSQRDSSMGWRSRGRPRALISFAQHWRGFILSFSVIGVFCIHWWLQTEHCSLSAINLDLQAEQLCPRIMSHLNFSQGNSRLLQTNVLKTNLNNLQLNQPKGISNPKINASTQNPPCQVSYLMAKSWLGIFTARHTFPCVLLGPVQANISLGLGGNSKANWCSCNHVYS